MGAESHIGEPHLSLRRGPPMSQIHHHEGWGPQPCSSIQTTHAVAWEPPDGTLSFLQGVKQACREASRI